MGTAHETCPALVINNEEIQQLITCLCFLSYKSEVFSCPFHLSHKEKHYCCEVLLDGCWDSINVVSAPVKEKVM